MLNETLGSILGEISFPDPDVQVKTELIDCVETVGDVLTKAPLHQQEVKQVKICMKTSNSLLSPTN